MGFQRHSLLALLGAASLFSACTKEKIVVKEVTPTHSWRQDSSLLGSDRILLASVPAADSSLVLASNYAAWVVPRSFPGPASADAIRGAGTINADPGYGYLVPPALQRDISTALLGPNTLAIFPTLRPVSSNQTRIHFTPSYSASNTSVKAFPVPANQRPGYQVVNSRYVLAPTELDNTRIYCSLLRVGPKAGFPASLPTLELKSTRQIVLTPAAGTTGFANGYYFSAAYFHKYFLDLGGQFFRVDTAGQVKAFGPVLAAGLGGSVSQMFTIGSTLFAVKFQSVYASDDQGETWRLHTSFSNVDGFPQIKFTNVGKRAYAYFRSQLWQVQLNNNTLRLTELDNDGLQTNQITSISKNGGHVFITTLAGLFYRDTASFHTPRQLL